VLERRRESGFPEQQALWGNRRYWPAVRAWSDPQYGFRGQEMVGHVANRIQGALYRDVYLTHQFQRKLEEFTQRGGNARLARQAALEDDATGSECFEMAAKEWLERRRKR
jgi:hypothetical protein